MNNYPIDLDPGAGTTIYTSNYTHNTCLLKLDSNWNYMWHYQWPFINGNLVYFFSVQLDKYENPTVSGHISGSMYLNPIANSDYSPGAVDNEVALVVKYSPNGNVIWNYRAMSNSGGFMSQYSSHLSKINNNMSIVGIYNGDSIMPDPSNLLNVLPSVPLWSNKFGSYIISLDSLGNIINAFGLYNDSLVDANSTAISSENEIYFVGDVLDTLDLDPTNDTVFIYCPYIPYMNNHKSFIVKYTNCPVDTGFILIEACEPYEYLDTVYYASGVYYYTIELANECDSIVKLDLTIHNQYELNKDTTICEPQTINGQLIQESGTYTFSYQTSAGCDSIIHLMVNLPEISSNYLIIDNGQGRKAVQENASYQWISCDSDSLFSVLVNDTGQSLISNQGGRFAVIITKDGCIDTLDCFEIFPLGLVPAISDKILLYPNPTSDLFVINSELEINGCDILSSEGKLVKSYSGLGRKQIMCAVSDLSSGFYMVEVKFIDGNSARRKISIER